MAAIDKLLNPVIDVQNSDSEFEPIRDQLLTRHEIDSMHSLRKKQKICKDAAIFIRGPLRGECRYPPHEYQDDELSAYHQQFEVYPMGEIADYRRHIPYNSEKKSFWDKTARQSLEVFQYQFKVPGDNTIYSMLWDYNIGLVRTTPLFKCTGHSKTTPAKMLNRNPGLRDICHSITGGALVAQGYWVPYEAAKAIAATFCWSIRYALTPVFGVDFPQLCRHPDDPKYGDMVIDPAVTSRCKEQAMAYRQTELAACASRESSVTAASSPSMPTTPMTTSQRSNRSRPMTADGGSSGSELSTDTGDGNDDDEEEDYGLTSPHSSCSVRRTNVDTPRSVPRLASPCRIPRHAVPIQKLGRLKHQPTHATSYASKYSQHPYSSRGGGCADQDQVNNNHDGSSSGDVGRSDYNDDHDKDNNFRSQIRTQGPTRSPRDIQAAYLLSHFKTHGGKPLTQGESKKRRASM